MNETDVVVVGGGPIGLMTALGLARAGVEVMVVDPATEPEGFGWSGVLHNAVLPHLDSLGVLPDVIVAGFADPLWSLSVLRTGEQIVFDLGDLADRLAHPFNVYVESAPLIGVLESHLAVQPGVTWRRGEQVLDVRQDASGVEVVLGADEARVRAAWMVGADGANSAVRRAVGLGFPGSTWPERSVAALVEYDFAELGYTASTFQVDEVNGAVVQRVRDGLWRYTYAEALLLPEAGIRERMERTLGVVIPGSRAMVVDWTWARMHQRTASRFRAGHVLLAGESAHVANRLTGHRSVSGFLDSRDVVVALAAVLRGDADESILDGYAENRRRLFLDHASPASKRRMHLVTDLAEGTSYADELDAFRMARTDADSHEELVMFGVDDPESGHSF
ncbi:FAD-dependent oxidoreductase [Nocardioides sp. Root140]|uniref:FAD-dependent oxidoreductase n=1 Tax=Nocardioides sp. Root140 TaxID=1736460 RepID=UPI0006FA8C8B|nr:NAD(P)/FAD-dependent oxidoreductase [Nocardioides sp. Root140]KQY50052.1 hypothetical protein ASD30_21180 [Nocardioides sp. Root140]